MRPGFGHQFLVKISSRRLIFTKNSRPRRFAPAERIPQGFARTSLRILLELTYLVVTHKSLDRNFVRSLHDQYTFWLSQIRAQKVLRSYAHSLLTRLGIFALSTAQTKISLRLGLAKTLTQVRVSYANPPARIRPRLNFCRRKSLSGHELACFSY